jgi:hypothetical protein
LFLEVSYFAHLPASANFYIWVTTLKKSQAPVQTAVMVIESMWLLLGDEYECDRHQANYEISRDKY